MVHVLKIKQCFLIHVLQGRKTFEVRKNDRDYQVGDSIEFLPISDTNYNVYELFIDIPYFRITYVHCGLGMVSDYVVLSIEKEEV